MNNKSQTDQASDKLSTRCSANIRTAASLDSKKTKKQFLKNVGSGWLAVAANALIGVFLLPINLHYLGKEVYAITVLAASIIAVLSYLNFGLGPTLLRFFSIAIAENDCQKIKRLSSTTQFLTGALGLIGAIIFMACFPWFCETYKIGPELRFPTFFLFCALAVEFWETFYLMTFSAILQGYQRFDLLNLLRCLAVVLRVVLLIVFYQFFWRSLISFAIVSLIVVTIRIVFIIHGAHKYSKKACRFSWKEVDFSVKKDGLLAKLLSFSSLAFLNNICYGMSIQLPALIIGKELGKSAVADFSVALTIANFLSHILIAISAPLAPLASLDAQQGRKRLGSWATSISLVGSCIGYAAILILCVLGRDWITVWLGESFAWTISIVVVIAWGIVLGSVQNANYNLAIGADSIAPVAWSSLVMMILVTVGTWLGLHYRHECWSFLGRHIELPQVDTHFAGLLGVAFLIGGVRFLRNVIYLSYSYSKRFNYDYWRYLYIVYLSPFIGVAVVWGLWYFTLGQVDFTPLQDAFLRVVHKERFALLFVTTLKTAVLGIAFVAYCWFLVLPKAVKDPLTDVVRRKLLSKR